MVSTSLPLMWVMTSPVFRPQSRPGLWGPDWVSTWDRPTTSTPSEKSLIPTAFPMGMTLRTAALPTDGAAAQGVSRAAGHRRRRPGLCPPQAQDHCQAQRRSPGQQEHSRP